MDPAKQGPKKLIPYATAYEVTLRYRSANVEGETSQEPFQKQSGNKRPAANQDPQESQTNHANQNWKKDFNPNAGVPPQKPDYQPGSRPNYIPSEGQ